MATVKRLEDYPEKWGQFFIDALNAPVEVSFNSASIAENFRNQLYAYRRALAAAEGIVEGYEEIMLMAPLARMHLRQNVVTIYYDPEDLKAHAASHSNSNQSKPKATADNPAGGSGKGKVSDAG